MTHRLTPVWLWLLLAALLLAACGGTGEATAVSPPPSPTPPATATLPPTTPSPEETPATGLADVLVDPIGALPGTLDEIANAIAQRTPVPTQMPDAIERYVNEVAATSGLDETTIFGLSGSDWLNILASTVMIILGTLLVNLLLLAVLRWLVAQTPISFDNEMLAALETPLRWLVLVIIARAAVLRLDIWSDQWAAWLDDIFFFLTLGAVTFGVFRLIAFLADWYLRNRVAADQRSRVAPLLTIITRLGYLLFLVVAGALALARLGVNVTLLSAVLLFLGLIIGLGARDAISDAVSGAFFLLDQRFRVGDEIYMPELDTRGTVVDVGIRQTRLQTYDNNIAIVPNSLIAGSQIINFSIPDPSYRLNTEVGVSYDADLDPVIELLEGAVRSVGSVLPDKPVDIYFMSFGDSARLMSIYWWVTGNDDRFQSISRVNAAIERTLDTAGVEMPFNTLDVNVRPPGDPGKA